MRHIDQENDDAEWQDWMEMTDTEIDAEERRVTRQYEELCARIDKLPVPQRVAYHRGLLLDDILKNRRRLRDPRLYRLDVIDAMFRQSIRRCQVRLVKLRVWRSTGVYPGATS